MNDKLNVIRLHEPAKPDVVGASAFEFRQTLFLQPVMTFLREQRAAGRRRADRLLHEICRGRWESEFVFSTPSAPDRSHNLVGFDSSVIGVIRHDAVHLNVSLSGLVADVRICRRLGELVVAGVWWVDDLDPHTDPDGSPELQSMEDDDHGVVVVLRGDVPGALRLGERSGKASASDEGVSEAHVVWLDALQGRGNQGGIAVTQRHLLWADARYLASSIPLTLVCALAASAVYGYSWGALLDFLFR